jgi:hypothetical protein
MNEFTVMLTLLVVAPAVLVASLAFLPHWGIVHLAIHAIAVATCLAFVFIWGKYTLMGSYYLRFFLPVSFVVAVVIAWRRKRISSDKLTTIGRLVQIATIVGSLALAYFAGMQVHSAVVGLSYASNLGFIDLAFPLRNGRYFISDGGTNRMMNVHYRPNTPGQKFAIDIVKLDALGSLSRSFFSVAAADANIFGTNVYAPCAGLVTESEDGVPDHKIGDYDEKHPLGNHVVLNCNGLLVEMAHFRNGSVRVHPNQAVKIGDPLGAVGNSGFSDEPHLHIQASKLLQGPSVSAEEVGVPMKFSGQFLSRNDIVVAR